MPMMTTTMNGIAKEEERVAVVNGFLFVNRLLRVFHLRPDVDIRLICRNGSTMIRGLKKSTHHPDSAISAKMLLPIKVT